MGGRQKENKNLIHESSYLEIPGPLKEEEEKKRLRWLQIHSLKNNRQGGEDAMREHR